MLYGILIVVHVIICVSLILIVLIQAGRGGGLAENFSGAESIFGTKTSSFLTKSTTVFAVMFFITCLSLAFISKQRSKSLIGAKPKAVKTQEKAAQEQEPSPKQEQEPSPKQDVDKQASAPEAEFPVSKPE